MKSKLRLGLVVLFIAVLSASVVHADEPGPVGVEETVSDTGESADPVTARLPVIVRLESEVLRYYRGVGTEPTEAELKSGLKAASDMVLADVAIDRISLAIDEAIKRRESAEVVPFAVMVPRFVRALAESGSRAPQEAAGSQDSVGHGASTITPDWRNRFHLEIRRQGRDRAKITAIMSGVFGGVGLAVGLPHVGNCGGGDICLGIFVSIGHLIALGSANQLSGAIAVSLAGIHGLVANAATPEALIAKLRRARIATGIAALAVGISAVVVAPALDYSWFGVGGATGAGLGLAAFSLLAVSSAHFSFEVDFKKMITAGSASSQRKVTRPMIALAPGITPLRDGLSLGLVGAF